MKVMMVEFVDEAKAFLDYCENKGLSADQFHIVAVWPGVQAFFKKMNVPYVNTLPYFTNESHQRVILKSEEWLESIDEALSISDGSKIRHSYNSVFKFYLRPYINHFLLMTELLTCICSRHNVECFLACVFKRRGADTGNPTIQLNERYLGLVAKQVAENRGIIFEAIPHSIDSEPHTDVKHDSLRTRSEQFCVSLLSRLYYWKFERFSYAPVILVNTLGYNIARVAKQLREKFPKTRWVLLRTAPVNLKSLVWLLLSEKNVDMVVPLDVIAGRLSEDASANRQMKESLKKIEILVEMEWRTSFRYQGVSFVDILLPKINDLLIFMRLLVNKVNVLRFVLNKIKPRLIISPFAIGIDNVLGELGTILGIPSLTISHGTFIPPQNRLDEIEEYHLGTSIILSEYGYTALQTPWAEKYINHFKEKCRPKPLRTGNLIFAKINPKERPKNRREFFNIQDDKTKIIIYATTLKPRHGLRFHTHETLDEHLAGVADLVDAVKGMENVHLVIKLHPALALKKEEIATLVQGIDSDQISIETKRPFQKVLSCADLVVSYSSTCIEDSIQNHIPVLLYDRWNRYRHLPATELGNNGEKAVSPVYYVKSKQELRDSLIWIFNNHNHSLISPDILKQHIYPEDTFENFIEFVENQICKPQSQKNISLVSISK